MKLLITLLLLVKMLLGNSAVDFKVKTEENRALILEQKALVGFYPFKGNPWFEDEKFSRELLDKYIYAVRFIKNEKVLNDKSLFQNMNASIYGYTGEAIRSDKEILLSFAKYEFSDYQLFQYASQSLKKDKAFVNTLLDRGENVYYYIDESIKDDEIIVQKSMNLSLLNYKYLPKKLKKDKALTIQAIKGHGYLLQHADDSLKDDIDVVSLGLLHDTSGIKYASSRLKDNTELMLKVINKSPYIVEYASERLRDNKAFMLEVLKKNFRLIKYASNRLKKDKEMMMASVSKYHSKSFHVADSVLKKDKEYIKKLIQKNGNILIDADKSLHNDMTLIALALDNGLHTLSFASEEIQKNRKFALKLLSNNHRSIQHAHQSLYKDPIYMHEAVKEDPFYIQYVQGRLKDDIDLALMAIKQNVQVYIYISDTLQKNSLIKAYLPTQEEKIHFIKPSIQQRKGVIRNVSVSSTLFGGDRITKLTLTKLITYLPKDYLDSPRIRVPIKVMATYDDGHSEEVTDRVKWKYSNKRKLRCYSSGFCQFRGKKARVWALLDAVTSNKLDISLKLKSKEDKDFTVIEPRLEEKKGAIRGVSIQFSILSDTRALKYKLINPPKGMKIVESHSVGGCTSTFRKYVRYALDGIIVQWDVPMDAIEGKFYDIRVRAIDLKGKIKEISFSIKVPKTKPIETKLVNNELIVTDKNSSLYGMKMKGHNGEDISKIRLRSVDYRGVWKKRVKNKKAGDVVERMVFILDNMPLAIDMKAPNLFDTNDKWIKTGAKIYKFYESVYSDYWEDSYMVAIGAVQYDGISSYIIPHKTSWDRNDGSKVFMFILGKAQNKGTL